MSRFYKLLLRGVTCGPWPKIISAPASIRVWANLNIPRSSPWKISCFSERADIHHLQHLHEKKQLQCHHWIKFPKYNCPGLLDMVHAYAIAVRVRRPHRIWFLPSRMWHIVLGSWPVWYKPPASRVLIVLRYHRNLRDYLQCSSHQTRWFTRFCILFRTAKWRIFGSRSNVTAFIQQRAFQIAERNVCIAEDVRFLSSEFAIIGRGSTGRIIVPIMISPTPMTVIVSFGIDCAEAMKRKRNARAIRVRM